MLTQFRASVSGIALMIMACSWTYGADWKGIVPLESKRKDIETLVGLPVSLTGNSYETSNEKIFVEYTGKPCNEAAKKGWNVPADTVYSITVYPKNFQPFSEAETYKSRTYQKVQNPHIREIVYYKNEDDGIIIEVNQFQVITLSTIYLPTKKREREVTCGFDQVLAESGKVDLCKDNRKPVDWFPGARYSHEPKNMDLDPIAWALKNTNSKMKIYIIVYGKNKIKSKRIASRLKRYLIKKHRIAAPLIAKLYGGYCEDTSVDVVVLPPEIILPPPVPCR